VTSGFEWKLDGLVREYRNRSGKHERRLELCKATSISSTALTRAKLSVIVATRGQPRQPVNLVVSDPNDGLVSTKGMALYVLAVFKPTISQPLEPVALSAGKKS